MSPFFTIETPFGTFPVTEKGGFIPTKRGIVTVSLTNNLPPHRAGPSRRTWAIEGPSGCHRLEEVSDEPGVFWSGAMGGKNMSRLKAHVEGFVKYNNQPLEEK